MAREGMKNEVLKRERVYLAVAASLDHHVPDDAISHAGLIVAFAVREQLNRRETSANHLVQEGGSRLRFAVASVDRDA